MAYGAKAMRGKRYSAEEIVNKPGILILSMLHWNSPINIGSVLGIATWIPGLLFVPACFLLGYAATWSWSRQLRAHLQHQKGIPICISCGYDLQGQAGARCPECGRDFDPSLLGLDTTEHDALRWIPS